MRLAQLTHDGCERLQPLRVAPEVHVECAHVWEQRRILCEEDQQRGVACAATTEQFFVFIL